MTTKPSKRFSLANLTKSFQTTKLNTPPSTPPAHGNKRRPEKTQSLYIKPSSSPSPPLSPSEASQAPRPSFQEELPKKSHTQHIKKTIRRSLSVIMYANPGSSSQQQDEKSHLVPVLVTPNVADPMMLMEKKQPPPDSPPSSPTSLVKKKQPKRILEYDNTIIIEPLSAQKDDILILWQGYGYTVAPEQEPRMESFDKDRWATYQGLIHPMFLFDDDRNERWEALTVAELRRYYDNYGSMMLKQREWRQQQQTLQYHPPAAAIMTL